MRISINENYPEIPEYLSSDVYLLIFNLLALIRRTYKAQEMNQVSPEKAIEASIAFARERHPEVLDKTPAEIAELISQKRLAMSRR